MTVPTIVAAGPHGPGGAPLLVLGPSLGTSTLLWDDAGAILGDRYRVLTWDLPGHGLSPAAPEPFTVGELADAVVRVLDELGEARIRYAGVSLGGAVGLELLLRHPDRVEAAAIICSAARISEPAAWHDRAAHVRVQGTASLVVPSAQRWFAAGSIERHPVVTGRLLHALRDADDESYARCCEALALFDARGALGAIDAPVLVLRGAEDPVISEADAVLVADGVRDGRLVTVEGAGHLAPAEQPEVVAEHLLAFFDGVGAGGAFAGGAGASDTRGAAAGGAGAGGTSAGGVGADGTDGTGDASAGGAGAGGTGGASAGGAGADGTRGAAAEGEDVGRARGARATGALSRGAGGARATGASAGDADGARADGARATGEPDATDAGRRAAGMAARRSVLGEEHVDRAVAGTTDLTRDFQDFITRTAWGDVWQRPGLSRRDRSIAVITSLIAHGHHEELALHLRAAIRNGLTREEIAEVILQSAIYSGVPAANTAFRIASGVFGDPS